MPENFNAIIGLRGADNMGGYLNRLAVIPAHSVITVPKIPQYVEGESGPETIIATGAFVFKSAQYGKPIGIEATDGTVKYGAQSQGENEGKSFNPQGEFFRAGSKVEYAAAARRFNNTPCYIVLEEASTGKQILVGQPGLEAQLTAEYDGGQKRADRRGIKFSFSADSVTPIIYLETPINIGALFLSDIENATGGLIIQ